MIQWQRGYRHIKLHLSSKENLILFYFEAIAKQIKKHDLKMVDKNYDKQS